LKLRIETALSLLRSGDSMPVSGTDSTMTVTLKEYFDEKFKLLDRANEVAFRAMERRLEGMNEFRDTLRDQATRFVTRDEFTIIKDRLDSDIRVLRDFKSELTGKASQASVNAATIVGFLGLLVGAVGLLVRLLGK